MCACAHLHEYTFMCVRAGIHTPWHAAGPENNLRYPSFLAFCLIGDRIPLLSSAVYATLAGSEAHRDPSVSTSQLTTRERHYHCRVLSHLALHGPGDLNPSLHLPQEPFPPPINCSLKPLNSRGSLGGSNKQSKFPEHMKSSNKSH